MQGEFLQRKMEVLKSKPSEVKSTSLTYIQMAIVHFRLTEISYQAPEKEVTHLQIEPLAIYSINERWIVIAWCRLRKDYRSFRLDRIHHFRMLEERFADRNFDLGNYFLTCEEIDHNP